MKAKARILSRMGWLLTLAAILVPARPAFAQTDNRVPAALWGHSFSSFALFSWWRMCITPWRLVRVDSNLEYHSDVEHRTETYLVDHSVLNPAGQHRLHHYRLDGDCRGS
jgi:hypothetical protein